jgi:hypothetical protein
VLPTGDAPHLGTMLEIIMLTVTGGQERTRPEYRALLDKPGFSLERIAVSIIEAFAA